MDCRLEFIYYLTRPKDCYINIHKHECYELVYYISGSGKTSVNSNEFTYKQNNVSLIKPRVFHDERAETETNVLFIGFEYDGNPLALDNVMLLDTPQLVIQRILFKLKTEMIEKKAFYELKMQSLLQQLIIEIIRIENTKQDSKRDLSYIREFLKENYAQENIDYQILAQLTGYSYHRFRHIFKETFHYPPHQYVLKLKLDKSKEMLLSRDFTVSRIALENGFSSESQFCSLFKREFGLSPTRYRAEII